MGMTIPPTMTGAMTTMVVPMQMTALAMTAIDDDDADDDSVALVPAWQSAVFATSTF